jgi:hypothetical protein
MPADNAQTPQLHNVTALVGAGALCLFSSLFGCSMGQSSANLSSPVTTLGARQVQGHVHGGQQSVSGATIQLYAAGTPTGSGGGYGVGAVALIPTGSYSPGGQPGCTGGNCTTLPQTDASGNFSITGDYTCPAHVSQIYMVASGGNPGLGGTVNNTNLALMAALGPCPANGTLSGSVPFIDIDEVTTVAGVWALQQFMAAPSSGNALAPVIGAPGTSYSNNLSSPTTVQSAVIGLQNAFTTAAVLADVSTGLSPNTNYSYATPESAKINTFADILAYCINSNPSATPNCGNLLAAATPTGFPTAKDTIQAAWYMAQNPSTNYASLYAFVGGAGAPFQPTVGAPTAGAPGDFTVAISYAPTYSNGGNETFGVAAPFGVAIDAYGNAWFSNTGGVANSAFASGVELGADGSVITQPVANFAVCNSATCGAHALFTTTPSLASHSFNAPRGLAIDLSNNAWITNSNDTIAVAAVPSAGVVAVLNGSTATGVAGDGGGSGATGYYTNYTPTGIAIDGSDHVFISSGTTNAVSAASLLGARSVAKLFASGGTGFVFSNQTSAAAPNSTPGGQALLAIDANSNVGAGGMVWALNSNGCKVQGNYQATTTPWGTINEFMDVDLSSPTGSEAVSSYAAPSLGAGSSTNCGTSGITVGQILTAGMANPFGIAIDHQNGAFISDALTSSVGFDGLTYVRAPNGASGLAPGSFSVVDGSAGSVSAAPTPGTTLQRAAGVAVDGNGRAWIVNQSTNSIVEASFSAGAFTFYTPGAGGTGGVGFIHPISGSGAANDVGVAIDPSGNVWVSSTNTSATYTNQLGGTTKTANSATVIVGAAAPVVTPLSLAIANNALGAKP